MVLSPSLLRIVGFLCSVYAIEKTEENNDIKSVKDNSIKTGSIRNENSTKLIFYEYTFWSETQIYEEKTNLKEAITETINATYSFDILHHDSQGKILARYRLLKCISGACNFEMPDIFVDFIQGGNNLEGLYVATEENDLKANWNVLFAIVYTIVTPAKSGAGDEQNVVTPYGLCHYHFSKPRDKIFRRLIDHCEFDGIRNYSAINGLTEQHYQQSVFYVQNLKVDADIIDIEAEEKMSLKSSFNHDWSLIIESKLLLSFFWSKMQMTNRTSLYINRYCPKELLAGDCAKQIFEAKRLGRNWKEIRQNLNIGVKKKRSKIQTVLEKCNNELSNKDNDFLATILSSVLFAKPDDLSNAVRLYKNASIMPIFVDTLGLAGTKASYSVGKNVLFIEAPEYEERYLRALAFTTKIDMVIVDDLKAWMKNTHDKNLKQQIAFTIAILYRRYCESSKSRKNACENGKDKDVNEFTEYITMCQDNECHLNALRILQNLPLPELLPYASQFLCSKSDVEKLLQKEALRFLQYIDAKYLHWKTITQLLRIFRNTCPLRQAISDQTLAIEVLLNAVPEKELIGTYMLRSEELFPKEQEKWSYFYGSVARRRKINAEVDSYWAKMRSFRVFRTNYAHRSLSATSDVSVINIAEIGDKNITVWVKTANDQGILSWNDFSIIITSRKASPFLLMQINSFLIIGGLTSRLCGIGYSNIGLPITSMEKEWMKLQLIKVFTETRGLNSYLADGEKYSISDDIDPEDPWASAQLTLLNARMVPVTLFNGSAELLSAVWNADGKPMLLENTNLIYRHYYGYVPLLSGLSVTLDIMGTMSIAFYGSASVSLWNKDARMTINSTVSTVMEGSISLASTVGAIGKATTSLSVIGTFTTQYEADFYTVPHLLCTSASHSPTVIRHSYTHSTKLGRDRRLRREKMIYGSSLLLNQRSSDHCSLLEGHFDSY